MGFSLEMFFEELDAVLAKDQKAAKTVKELKRIIGEAEIYAMECGQIRKEG